MLNPEMLVNAFVTVEIGVKTKANRQKCSPSRSGRNSDIKAYRHVPL